MSQDELNPYAPPQSSLTQAQQGTVLPNLGDDYHFGIDALINQGWQRVNGIKWILVCGMLIYGLANLIISLALLPAFTALEVALSMQLETSTQQAIASILSTPFLAGPMMVGIRRAADQPVEFDELFRHFGKAPLLIAAATMVYALTFVGFFLLFIPGVYLTLAYLLVSALIVERGLSPWQAMEASRKAITRHWLKVFGLMFTLTLIMLLSALPLFIGWIWTVPLLAICMGLLYRTIFGVQPITQ